MELHKTKNKKYTDWYVDPSYSNSQTLWNNGFAICIVPSRENGTWTLQVFDEFSSEPHPTLLFETEPFENMETARSAAENSITELSRD